MDNKKIKSFETFNRVIEGGHDKLITWLSLSDDKEIANNIIKLYQDSTINNSKASTRKGRLLINKILGGDIKKSNVATFEYKGLHILVRNATSKEYLTRSKCWTFNFIEMGRFDYIILIGQDDKNVNYWLLSESEMRNNTLTNTNNQNIRNVESFSLGISTKTESTSWDKYKNYLINIKKLKTILDKSLEIK